jgi:hypothetical protein
LVSCILAAVALLARCYAYSAGPGEKVTEDFLTDLEKDDTAAAYRLLCLEVRAQLGEGSFADFVHAQHGLRGHTVVDTSESTVDGTDTALVTVDLAQTDGGRDRRTVRLVRDLGAWRVCGPPHSPY